MARPEKLFRILESIDGQGYGAYKEILGRYDFGEYILFIDHVQADPFAAPSRMRINVPAGVAGFPADLFDDDPGRIAVGDFLARAMAEAIRTHAKGVRGSGSSGSLEIDRPGPEILDRTAVSIRPGGIVDARIFVGLPAQGRRIAAKVLRTLVRKELPAIIQDALSSQAVDGDALATHVAAARTQNALRAQLSDHGLVAFVADGSRLPRRSGVDDRPLREDRTVAFESPESLRVTLTLEDGRTFTGAGIPSGVTLIVGGGFHGKSTLLRALERGVYDHVPGDGRELVVTDATAVKIRAEDGRRVEKVDISPFVTNLPLGRDTRSFATDLASGSTSQAANIMESLAAGARTLLIDEDTSATNFLIRDHRMQKVVPAESEPITPFIDRVRELHQKLGVSTVLVLGGCGDYLDVADTVVHMNAYRPEDATERARAVAAELPTGRAVEAQPLAEVAFPERKLLLGTFAETGSRRGESKIRAKGREVILHGKSPIDLTALEQIVDASQTTALAEAIRMIRDDFADGHRTIEELVALVIQRIDAEGLDALTRRPTGGLARFRGLELAAALNRLRSLRVTLER